MPMLSQVGENTRFLALLLEPLQRAFKVLVVVNDDFRQTYRPRVNRGARYSGAVNSVSLIN